MGLKQANEDPRFLYQERFVYCVVQQLPVLRVIMPGWKEISDNLSSMAFS